MIVLHANFTTKVGAGTKAPEDIYNILKNNLNVKSIYVQMKITSNKFMNNMRKIPFCIKKIFKLLFASKKEYIVLQSNYFDYPFVFPRLMSKILKKKKTIYYIHDINGLRYNDNKKLSLELKILDANNYIIAHNNCMKKFLVDNGINENKIYTLDCFDYLCSPKTVDVKREFNAADINVCYAGNLSKDKSQFIYEINNKNYTLNLFGKGINADINDKIKYKGVYEADKVRDYLHDDLGLIWDGHADDSYEYDNFKKYTYYNNPHKLSCYVAADMPVIVWSKSAIADFVKVNNVGYVIDKLEDIDSLNFSDYKVKKRNASIVGEKLRNGEYTLKVLNEIIKDIGE